MKEKYKKLFETVKLTNGEEIRNRIVMAPMTTFSGNEDGTISDEEIEYYKHRSKGLGMLITACIGVSKNGIAFPGQFEAFAEGAVPKLKKLTEALKEEGTKAILQIHHGGRMALPELVPDGIVVSAGNIPTPRMPDVIPHELDDKGIEEIIKDFGMATKMAIEAGFDGVEIHGANTYLIQQFFSPHSNRRNDKWGGSLEKRLLFPMRIIDEVKNAVKESGNSKFIIGYRFSPEEIETPGIRIDDTLYLVENLVNKKLDYLHISLQNVWEKSSMSPNVNKSMTEMVSEKINGRVPLITVGSIHTADDALEALASKSDFIALGREILMVPDWIEKVQNDKEDEIIVTISKNSQKELVIPEKLFSAMLNMSGRIPFKD